MKAAGLVSFIFFVLIAALQGCVAMPEQQAQERAVLDRLLALPLEALVTALEDDSIWKSG